VFLLQGATPIVLDHVFDVQQSYRLGVIGIAVCLVAGAALLILLPAYSPRGPSHQPKLAKANG